MQHIWIGPHVMSASDIEAFRAHFPTLHISTELVPPRDTEAMICWPTLVKTDIIDSLPSLRWIQIISAGYDQIDTGMLQKRKILFTNARGVYSKTIAEDVFSKILAINRNTHYYYENMKTGTWSPIYKEHEIAGSTVGILGAGSIAKEIAKRMKAFDAQVIGYRRKEEVEEYFDEILTQSSGLNTLLQRSDYVIICLPLNPQTRGLMNYERMMQMKGNAVLINIARGEIMVQEDLIRILKEKKIRAAGIDVTIPEPLPPNHEMWKLDSIFITPHNASSSPYISKRLLSLVIENVTLFQMNQPLMNQIG